MNFRKYLHLIFFIPSSVVVMIPILWMLGMGRVVVNLYLTASGSSWNMSKGVLYFKPIKGGWQIFGQNIQIVQNHTNNQLLVGKIVLQSTSDHWFLRLLNPKFSFYQKPLKYPIWSLLRNLDLHTKKSLWLSVQNMQVDFFMHGKSVMSLSHANFKFNDKEILGFAIFKVLQDMRMVSIYAHPANNRIFDNMQIKNLPLAVVSYFINPSLIFVNKNSFLNIHSNKHKTMILMKNTRVVMDYINHLIDFHGRINPLELWNLVIQVPKYSRITSSFLVSGFCSDSKCVSRIHIDPGFVSFPSDFSHHISLFGDIWFILKGRMSSYISGDLSLFKKSHLSFFLDSTDFFSRKSHLVRILLTNILPDDFYKLWPIDFMNSARVWITNNIHHGLIQKISFLGNLNQHGKLSDIHGKIFINNTVVNYLSPMSKAKAVTAGISYNTHGLKIMIHKGIIHHIDVSRSLLRINYHPITDSFSIHMNIHPNGSLFHLIRLLDQKPLSLIHSINDKLLYHVTGHIMGNLNLDFPLSSSLTPKQVHITSSGRINKLILFIHHYIFHSDNMRIVLMNRKIIISGVGFLNNFPMSWNLEKPFDTDIIKGHGVLQIPSQQMWPVQWNKPLSISFAYKKAHNQLSGHLSSDLTSYLISSPTLLFIKKPMSPLFLSAKISGSEDSGYHISKIIVVGNNVSIHADYFFDVKKHITHMSISPFIFPDNYGFFQITNTKNEHYVQLQLENSTFLWIKKLLLDSHSKSSVHLFWPSFHVHILINHILDATKRIVYKKFLCNWNRVSGHTRSFNIRALTPDEKTCISGQMNATFPQNIHFSICSLSTFLRALNYNVDSIGSLNIQGERKKYNAPIRGTIFLENYTMDNIPILSHLLKIISIVGVLNVGNSSILFQKMVLPYKFYDGMLSFKHGYMYSLSTGLTLDNGYIDFKKNYISIVGGIVPAFLINQAIANIPLIGHLLTGTNKGEGLLTANYLIEGSLQSPKISINPMSIFVPSVIRNLFSTHAPQIRNTKN